MKATVPLFYRALLLTAVNLVLRMAGTGFQVYLSRKIGAEGIGLLQLTLSVGSLAMVSGIGGIRTATMYLTAEELGKKNRPGLCRVLSGCFAYSMVCSLCVALALYLLSPTIAENWIGTPSITGTLRLFSCFLPISCLCSVMTGFFTGENRIGTLAAVEVLEQVFTMAITLACLHFYAGSDSGRACRCVILGSSLGSCLTLLLLRLLYRAEKNPQGPKIPVRSRILSAAVPLALADTLKSGIGTLENLMVPKRLALALRDPLAAFGRISGMVFPILMFPACILFGLSELLIPELARCSCSGGGKRIHYLLHKSLRVSLLYGTAFGGILFLSAEKLCCKLYGSPEAGLLLRQYAPLVPMLYCDAITDAITKGLGQQKMAVRYNIITNCLDVILLFFLLPRFGMQGYFFSFLLTHALNFFLSIRHLLRITGQCIAPYIPLTVAACGIGSLWACRSISSALLACCSFLLLFGSSLALTGVIRMEDLRWAGRLIGAK